MDQPDSQAILAMSAFDARDVALLDAEEQALVARRQRLLGPGSPLFYRHPIHLARADGVWMYDVDGTRYLDAYNNVPSVGHCHPHVVQAIARQAATLNTHTRYLCDTVLEYAERLLASFPPALSTIAFTCTGSESSDLAMRIARHATRGSGFVVTENAYHGNTTAVSEISPSSGPHVRIGAHVRTVPAPDSYRRPAADLGARFAGEVRAAIADLQRSGIKFAALIADSAFSSDGVFTDPPGFLAAAADAARAAGGLVIADEVQPGFARTGDAMWGFARHGIVPDLVVMGKPMGNGFPVAGVVAKPEVFEDFSRSAGYFNTFGGNPVAAAAGMAVLDVLEREQLMANAREVGAYLRAGLRQVAPRFPEIGDVRGAGLFVGVELSEAGDPDRPWGARARQVVEGLRDRHVLIGTAGKNGNVLKVRPPLCFSRENADLLLSALEDVLQRQLPR